MSKTFLQIGPSKKPWLVLHGRAATLTFCMIILFIGLFVMAACEPIIIEGKAKSATTDIKGYVDYTVDERSGICFARSMLRGGYYVYSPVECTKRVKALIINPAR